MTPEAGAVEFFTADHRACDGLWAAVEAAADAEDTETACTAFAAFDAATRRHFDMEEEVLFPAFEAVTGMTMGPTRVMRTEHAQMKGLLGQMEAAASAKDMASVVELGDTLLMLTQQHNMKEEGMLYPMAAGQLTAQWADIAARLRRYLSG